MIRQAYQRRPRDRAVQGRPSVRGRVAVITAVSGSAPWVTVVIAVAGVLAAVHLSTVRISVGDGRKCLGQGPWNRPARQIAVDTIVAARSLDLGWAQTFGLGVPFHRKTARLTVRPGPTLSLQVVTGEHIRISTPDPNAARELLAADQQEARWLMTDDRGSDPSASATACVHRLGKAGRSQQRSP